MPTKAEIRAKEIQKRAKEIADRAADVKEIEAQAQIIALRAKDIENEVINRTLNNGTTTKNVRDFSNKEVYLLLLDEMSKKLDKHIEFCDNMTSKYIPEFNKHVEILNQVCKDMPNKGFCENVDRMYHDFYPDKDESVPDKVKTLWYDRKILKWLLATSVGAIIVGSITLILGLIKGVF